MRRADKRRTTRRRRLMDWLIRLVVGYVLYAGALFVMQGRLMWPRHFLESGSKLGAPGVEALGVERFWIDTPHAHRVEAWYLRGRVPGEDTDQPRPLIVLAHGNAELIDDHLNQMLTYQQMGVSVLAVEYRGYGRSTGTPSQRNIVDDFTKAIDTTLARREVDADRVVYQGRSIGSGVVCALARRREPAGMILESAFTSAAGMAKRFGVPGFMVRSPFDNASVVKDFNGPILLMHGINDRIIPVSHAHKLKALAQNATLIEQDAGHNDFPRNTTAVWHEIEQWLQQISR